MMTKCLLGFAAMSLSLVSAATHNFTLYQPTMVNGTELKPGEYRLEVNGDHVVMSQGKKNRVEASVTAEATDTKNAKTVLRYDNADGKMRLQEIRLGGTNQKLVINDTSAKTGIAKPATAN